MKLTTLSSIEFKMEVYMHPTYALMACTGQLCVNFIFILAALLLCCLMSLAAIPTHSHLQAVVLAHSASVFLLNMFVKGLD